MKYCTWDLLQKNRTDLLGETGAGDLWDRALAAYTAEVKEFQRWLPEGARRLFNQGPLHDAQVLSASHSTGNLWGSELLLELKTDTKPHDEIYTLRYALTAPVRVVRHEPAGTHVEHAFWLYDEFAWAAVNQGSPTFTHSVLFENGLEVVVPFFKLAVKSKPAPQPLTLAQFVGKLS